MIVHVDTSALVDALTGPRRSIETMIRLADEGHRLTLSAIALYEWSRGPRTKQELAAQEALFPSEHVIAFGHAEAAAAARLYTLVKRPRGREVDLAIAATATVHGAALWTLNTADFRDITALRLI